MSVFKLGCREPDGIAARLISTEIKNSDNERITMIINRSGGILDQTDDAETFPVYLRLSVNKNDGQRCFRKDT